MFYIMSSFTYSATKVTRETVRLKRKEKQREVHVARLLLAGSVSQPMRRVGRHFQGRQFEKRSRARAPGRRGVRGFGKRSGGGQGGSSSGAAVEERTRGPDRCQSRCSARCWRARECHGDGCALTSRIKEPRERGLQRGGKGTYPSLREHFKSDRTQRL